MSERLERLDLDSIVKYYGAGIFNKRPNMYGDLDIVFQITPSEEDPDDLVLNPRGEKYASVGEEEFKNAVEKHNKEINEDLDPKSRRTYS